MHSPFVHRPTSVSFGSFRSWYLGATVLDAHVRQSACLKRPPRVAPFLGRGEEGLRLGDLLARRQFLGARKTGDCHGVCPAIAYKQHKSKLPCAHNSTRDILKKKKKKTVGKLRWAKKPWSRKRRSASEKRDWNKYTETVAAGRNGERQQKPPSMPPGLSSWSVWMGTAHS